MREEAAVGVPLDEGRGPSRGGCMNTVMEHTQKQLGTH